MLDHAHDLGITDLDVAVTYQHGHAHRMLAAEAGRLLDEFAVSTKLSPRLPEPLVQQARQAITELGRAPDVLLLHNPEQVLATLPTDQVGPWWVETAATMQGLVSSGFCRSWGVATWDPRPLLRLLDTPYWQPVPVAMVRAGVLVPPTVLHAAETLLQHTRSGWGMSPFAADPGLLTGTGVRGLLTDPADGNDTAAAFAAAWHLPEHLERIAVGTSDPQHLTELAAAAQLPIDPGMICYYRQQLALVASAG